MCHQYAYSSILVDECLPILDGMEPMEFRWQWPTISCPDPPDLPPFDNQVDKEPKETTDDSDDDENTPIPEPIVKTYEYNPGSSH